MQTKLDDPRLFSLEWLLSLTGFRAAESGLDSRVFYIVVVVSTLVSIASGLAVSISDFRSARFT